MRNKVQAWGIRQVTVPPEMNESSEESLAMLAQLYEKMGGRQGIETSQLLKEILAPLKEQMVTEQLHRTGRCQW